MVHHTYARDMMTTLPTVVEDDDIRTFWFTKFCLTYFVIPLDDGGAWEWDLRLTSLVWFIFFAIIRHVFKQQHEDVEDVVEEEEKTTTSNGHSIPPNKETPITKKKKKRKRSSSINWYSLIHAIITGVGGTICAYLSFVSAELLTGKTGTLFCMCTI